MNFNTDSELFKLFLEEKEEILRHKWIESEKAGKDIGIERAILSWIRHHRKDWMREKRENLKRNK